ncbi:MAG: hypothetical protein QXR82_05945 [Candidatus Bathyarchaeia archaeon]
MIKKSIHSRKGVGTALGAVFYIGLVIFSLATLILISSYQMKYLQARDEMFEWDIKRMSENLNIISINQPSNRLGYTFDIIVNNTGGVLVKIARIYIYDNNEDKLWGIFDKQKTPGENGFINGEIIPGEGNHVISVKAQKALANEPVYRYRIIVATERGRQFSFSYPLPKLPPPSPPTTGEFSVLVVTFNLESFQYKDLDHVKWQPAWSKLRSFDKQHPLYRVNITNTGDKDIELQAQSWMGQQKVTTGEIKAIRYICSNKTEIWNRTPTPFDKLIIPAHSWRYVWFAGRDIKQSDWVNDPEPDIYHVSFIIYFNYVGEQGTFIMYVTDIVQEIQKID